MALGIASMYLDFGGVVISSEAAEKRGIKHGDIVIIESPYGKVKSKAIVREGQRPDVAVLVGQLGQWVAPRAKEIPEANINDLMGVYMDILDAGGSSCDLIKVRIYKAEG
jgi:anaerobic selenocysteine-containing dehydrogenase